MFQPGKLTTITFFTNASDSFTFQDVRDRELPNNLISMVQELNYKSGEADCILLLLCKLKPLVWSMQHAITERVKGEKTVTEDVNEKENFDRMNVFFKYVPSVDEFQNNGAECEETYPSCKLF